jgi:hypothetical protein
VGSHINDDYYTRQLTLTLELEGETNVIEVLTNESKKELLDYLELSYDLNGEKWDSNVEKMKQLQNQMTAIQLENKEIVEQMKRLVDKIHALREAME